MTVLFSLRNDQGEDADPAVAPSVSLAGPASCSTICIDRPAKSNVAMMGEGQVRYNSDLFNRTFAALFLLGIFKGSAVGGLYLNAADQISACLRLYITTPSKGDLGKYKLSSVRKRRKYLGVVPLRGDFSTFIRYYGGPQPVLADGASLGQPYFGVKQKL